MDLDRAAQITRDRSFALGEWEQYDKIWALIKQYVTPMLKHVSTKLTPTAKAAYELFGIDLALTNDWDMCCYEINSGPCIKPENKPMLHDLLDIALPFGFDPKRQDMAKQAFELLVDADPTAMRAALGVEESQQQQQPPPPQEAQKQPPPLSPAAIGTSVTAAAAAAAAAGGSSSGSGSCGDKLQTSSGPSDTQLVPAEWTEQVSNLSKRFGCGSDVALKVLQGANGHAGKAAAALRAQFKESPLERVQVPLSADVAEARAAAAAQPATSEADDGGASGSETSAVLAQQGLTEQLGKLHMTSQNAQVSADALDQPSAGSVVAAAGSSSDLASTLPVPVPVPVPVPALALEAADAEDHEGVAVQAASPAVRPAPEEEGAPTSLANDAGRGGVDR